MTRALIGGAAVWAMALAAADSPQVPQRLADTGLYLPGAPGRRVAGRRRSGARATAFDSGAD